MSENNEKKLPEELEEQNTAAVDGADESEIATENSGAENGDLGTPEDNEDNKEGKIKKDGSIPVYVRIIALVAALAIIIGSVFLVRACSAPPKYEEIEDRFKQLIEESYGVNLVLFGSGLPTYERVNDPLDSLSFYNTGELYDDDGVEKERRVSYYYTLRPEGDTRKVIAFRNSNAYTEKFSYAYVADRVESREMLELLFPAIEGVTPKDGQTFYSEIYRSDDGKTICYLIPYEELEYDFYYSDSDPENYDYVRNDSHCRTVAELKAYAETVYSDNYLISLYGPLFDGVVSGDVVSVARYTEYSDNGNSRLAQLNTYEPLFTERRVYDFNTAQIKKWGSNKNTVVITINSYLPSTPAIIYEDEITMVLDDGNWYLDGPTF